MVPPHSSLICRDRETNPLGWNSNQYYSSTADCVNRAFPLPFKDLFFLFPQKLRLLPKLSISENLCGRTVC